jgi:crossover junction endodeoxyribonuclease RusA
VIALTLPVPPSANRWWRSVGRRVLLSREARNYKKLVATMLLLERVTMIRPPAKVKVSVVWYRGRKAGDLDKRIGVLLDALQATAYENDAQITEIYARREDDRENPRIELEVSAV